MWGNRSAVQACSGPGVLLWQSWCWHPGLLFSVHCWALQWPPERCSAANENFPSTVAPSLSKLKMLFLCTECLLSTIRAIYQPSSQMENLSQGPCSPQSQRSQSWAVIPQPSGSQQAKKCKQTLPGPQSHICNSEIQKALKSGRFFYFFYIFIGV